MTAPQNKKTDLVSPPDLSEISTAVCMSNKHRAFGLCTILQLELLSSQFTKNIQL